MSFPLAWLPGGPASSVHGARGASAAAGCRLGRTLARFGVLVAVEGVGKRDGVDIVEIAVLRDRRIDEEGHRHLRRRMRRELLLGEAEALDLVEIGPGLERRDIEGR